jgi:hypothetical protein
LHYNWYRHYDPTIGRFTQPDPLGFVDGPSVYAYGRSSPARFTDFDGRVAPAIPLILGALAEGGTATGVACSRFASCRAAVSKFVQSTVKAIVDYCVGAMAAKPPTSVPNVGTGGVEKPDGIPDDWREEPTDGEGGRQWVNPDNPGDRVRVMPGKPDSPFPAQREPYVRDVRNGNQWLDRTGNRLEGRTGSKSPDTHIPVKDYKFRP